MNNDISLQQEEQRFDCECLNCEHVWQQKVSMHFIDILTVEQSQALIDRFLIDNFPCPICSSFCSVVIPCP
jgi:hypothetical protein